MRDPRMTAVQNDQPGFKKLKKSAARKSEHRSTMKSHKKGKGRKS